MALSVEREEVRVDGCDCRGGRSGAAAGEVLDGDRGWTALEGAA
jgi:hypothetical protein